MSRANAVSFKGTPMTLAGTALRVGQPAPDFNVSYFEGGFKELKLEDLLGKPTLISVVPSLDTGVCSMQTKKFNERLAELGNEINAITVSLDLPFAQNRFCTENKSTNIKSVSDYRDRSFGQKWGMLIEEIKLLARGVFVLDPSGKILYAETVNEVTAEPNYDEALKALHRALAISPT
jgi:thiol peroxidase